MSSRGTTSLRTESQLFPVLHNNENQEPAANASGAAAAAAAVGSKRKADEPSSTTRKLTVAQAPSFSTSVRSRTATTAAPAASVRSSTLSSSSSSSSSVRSGSSSLSSRSSSVPSTTAARSGAATSSRTATSTASSRSAAASASASTAADIDGRLRSLEGAIGPIRNELSGAKDEIVVLQRRLVEKEGAMDELRSQETELRHRLQQQTHLEEETRRAHGDLQARLERQAREHRDDVERMRVNQRDEVELLQARHREELNGAVARARALDIDLESARGKLRVAQEDIDRLRQSVAEQRDELAALEAQLQTVKRALDESEHDGRAKAARIEELEDKVFRQGEGIADLERKARDDETVRRKLHNTILELKGNIRVFCRMRPPATADEAADVAATGGVFSFPADHRTLEIAAAAGGSSSSSSSTSSSASSSSSSATAGAKKWNFTFDRVFGPTATQRAVFEEISQLAQSTLDGYNACIFAYGQTGSGKTFTMEGPEQPDDETRGMIPRAVEQIFSTAKHLEEKGWRYEMEVNFLEIYNETLRDLLCAKGDADKKLDIHHDGHGNTTVSNLTVVPVLRPAQVYELLKRAKKNRAVAATNCNERSSRSHSVFQLHLRGTNTITSEQCAGMLSLVDLAGSERLAQSGATGDRLRETQNINKSLAALGDVIAALAAKESHVPFRNSKLTYLLQNTLGGNSKTLMFVNVSPSERNLNETLSSLRFATKVNQCEIGTAKKAVAIDLNGL